MGQARFKVDSVRGTLSNAGRPRGGGHVEATLVGSEPLNNDGDGPWTSEKI
jgi:hypothetical protein